MAKKYFIPLSLVITALTVFCFSSAFKPLHLLSSAIHPAADTSSFTPNRNGGWQRMSVYMNQQTTDSASLEVILVHGTGISSSAELLTGTITNTAFIPTATQNISYQLLPGYTWNVKITTTGQFFVKQTQGQYVPGNPAILYVKIKYKNKY